MAQRTDAGAVALDVGRMLVHRIPVAAADRKGATENNIRRIVAIDSWDALGQHGCAHGEHSGQTLPVEPDDLLEELADNRFVREH